MTIVSGATLSRAARNGKPIVRPFISAKSVNNGMSYGVSLAGYDIRIAETVTLAGRSFFHPFRQRFALASTIEEFDMPNNVVGLVHDKSSLARRGLSMFNTVIEPGWRGYLTLELVYHGRKPLTLPTGSPIAQILFFYTDEPTAGYSGKYQDQKPGPQVAVNEPNRE